MSHTYSFVDTRLASNVRSARLASTRLRSAIFVALALTFGAMLFTGSFLASPAKAQNLALIHHKVVKSPNHPPALGRDFWTTMMSNYWGINLGGAYMRLYITSPNNTTAYVSCLGATTPVPIVAYTCSSFLIPSFWQNESSGIVEDKAIHIWSNDADLTVYDMNRNNATTDGSCIIPTIGWGTDYVVAAYGSLFEGSGSYIYDLPSEMAVISDQNNTQVTIIPSCNCRQCTGGSSAGDANSAIVVYPQGSPVTFDLQQGQDVELMPVKATGPDNFDMTGTIVHANVPVGVEGGSVCPNIPANFPYCDHVEENCPPTRTWAETYMGTNFAQPIGEPPGKDWGLYLFVASKPNQYIYVHTCVNGDAVATILPNTYSYSWLEYEGTTKFTSDAPFMCFEYLNSATYPDGVNGDGDPAEAGLMPREQFPKTVVFETPVADAQFYNYANITLNLKDANGKVLFGNTLASARPLNLPQRCVDGNWVIETINNVSEGSHVVGVNDDSGVGVYIYGYGFDESYAWVGSFGNATFNSPDTVAPDVDTVGQCTQASVHVTDSGEIAPPKNDSPQTGIAIVKLDSDYNMTYIAPLTGPAGNQVPFIEGSGVPSIDYSMYVTDPSKPAILVIDVYDVAGNETEITSSYLPVVDTIVPPLRNLGVQIAPAPANVAYDTIYNTGQGPVTIDNVSLKYGNKGFTLYDSIGGPISYPIVIQPGNRYLVQIQFMSPPGIVGTSLDSIIITNPCNTQAVAVVGSGGANDFSVTNDYWINVPDVPVPNGGYQRPVTIANLSSDTIVIDSASWTNSQYFKQALDTLTGKPITPFPIIIPPIGPKSLGTALFRFAYFPDATSIATPDIGKGTWYSPQVLSGGVESPRFDSLYGNAVGPSTTIVGDSLFVDSCIGTTDQITLEFPLTINATGSSASIITNVTQSGDTSLWHLTGSLANGQPWVIDSGDLSLSKDSATIFVGYTTPPDVNENQYDTIKIYDNEGNEIGTPIIVGDSIIYRSYSTDAPINGVQVTQTTTMPNGSLYQSALVTATYNIVNTNTAALTVSAINVIPSTPGPVQYVGAYTAAPTPPNTLPYTIPAGGQLNVTVKFNPSYSFDPVQAAKITYVTNACMIDTTPVSSQVYVDGALASGFVGAAILSCGTQTDTVTVGNAKPMRVPSDSSDDLNDVTDNIVNFSITGPDAQYFTAPNNPVNMTINGAISGAPATIASIPITFTPPALAVGQSQTYTATVTIESKSNDNTDTVMVVPISGTAASVGLMTTSNIAVSVTGGSNQATAGSSMYLPAQVAYNGFAPMSAFSVQQMNINQVILTYVIPKSDMLSLVEPTGQPNSAFTNQPSGWGVKVVPTLTNPTGPETIVVTLTNNSGSALSQNTTNFGNLSFTVDLDKADNSTPVTLQSVELDTISGGSFAQANNNTCLVSTDTSGVFSLITECGDVTLRGVLNGTANLSFAGPASPDPVTGTNVTFKFANGTAQNLTLAIYDALGNQVAIPINNVFQQAGVWQITSDVSKLPSGTFTYRLSGANGEAGPMAVSGQFVIER